ncbi:MAG: type II secretion system protein N [Novosphingobium sp.]
MIGRWIFLRDGRLSRRAWLALAGVFAAALIAALPLRVALCWSGADARGLSAREVGGTVWDGWIGQLRLGALPLGDVEAGLRPLPLLIGRREFALERIGPATTPEFSAIASGGSGWLALREVEGQVALGDGLGDLPASAIGFRGFRMALDDGRCREAGGQVSLILASISQLMPGGIALSGTARCDKGALYVPMTGPTGMEKLFLRLQGDGRWRADLVLRGLPVEVSAPLLDLGFAARPGGIGMSASGSL